MESTGRVTIGYEDFKALAHETIANTYLDEHMDVEALETGLAAKGLAMLGGHEKTFASTDEFHAVVPPIYEFIDNAINALVLGFDC